MLRFEINIDFYPFVKYTSTVWQFWQCQLHWMGEINWSYQCHWRPCERGEHSTSFFGDSWKIVWNRLGMVGMWKPFKVLPFFISLKIHIKYNSLRSFSENWHMWYFQLIKLLKKLSTITCWRFLSFFQTNFKSRWFFVYVGMIGTYIYVNGKFVQTRYFVNGNHN